jgi:hypothetical protein
MGLLSSPAYQDYLQNYGRGGDGALSQDQWNALTDAQKWQNVGSGLAIAKTDPRYADLAKQMGVTDGGLLNLAYAPQSIAVNGQNYVDPSKVVTDGSVYGTAHSNETPKTQFAGGGLSDKEWALLATSLIGGGALGAFDGLGAAGGTGTGAGVEGGFTGYGDIAASGAAPGGAAGSVAGLPDSYWSQVADSGQVGTDGAVDGGDGLLSNSGGYGGLDPETASGQYGGMGVAQNGIGPGSWQDILQGTISNPGSLAGRAGDLLGQAGTWALNNPLRAAGLAQTAYGLLGGHRSTGGSSSSSSSKGGSGTPGAPMKVNGPQYYVNPYIAAQIQRGYGQ